MQWLIMEAMQPAEHYRGRRKVESSKGFRDPLISRAILNVGEARVANQSYPVDGGSDESPVGVVVVRPQWGGQGSQPVASLEQESGTDTRDDLRHARHPPSSAQSR